MYSNTDTLIKNNSAPKIREYYRLFNYFCTRAEQWFNIHSDLCSFLLNIFTIRKSLLLSLNVLRSFQIQSIPTWKTRGHSNFLCNDNFVEIKEIKTMIGNNLIILEEFYDLTRIEIFKLAECQDSLSRRLEDLLLHELEPLFFINVHDQRLTTKGKKIYDELSIELYRKQMLVQGLLEKSDDKHILHGKPSKEIFGQYIHTHTKQKDLINQENILEIYLKELKNKCSSRLKKLESEIRDYNKKNNLGKK